MNTRSRCAAPLLTLLLLAAAPAAADVPDADRATARTLANEGQNALEARDYATATDRFGRADALVHAPSLLLGLARAQVGLGRLVSAQETYRRILREGLPPHPPPAFVTALEEARRESEALALRVPSVTITVQGPAGAAVTVDGAPVPSAALGARRPVDPGRHVLRAVAGAAVAEEVVEAEEGKVLTVTLVPRPPVPAPRPRVEQAPPPPEPVPAKGTARSPLATAGVVTLAIGGAGIALGAGTGIASLVERGKLLGKCPNGVCPKSEQSAVSTYDTTRTVAVVGLAVGGAAAVTGVALLVAAPKAKPVREAAVTPLIGPGFVGVTGRFQ